MGQSFRSRIICSQNHIGTESQNKTVSSRERQNQSQRGRITDTASHGQNKRERQNHRDTESYVDIRTWGQNPSMGQYHRERETKSHVDRITELGRITEANNLLASQLYRILQRNRIATS